LCIRSDSPVRTVKKTFLLLALASLLSVSGAAYESCSTSGAIHSDGSMELNFEWDIRAESGYYYPADGDWSLFLSEQAQDIQVVNGEGEEVEYEVRSAEGSYKELSMSNGERISDNEIYTFNVSYDLPRAAAVYEDKLILDRSFFNFCSDENSLKIRIPEQFDVQNRYYSSQSNQILIQDFSQDRLNVKMTSNTIVSPTVNYRSNIFNISSPRVYKDFVLEQVTDADKDLSNLQDYTGLPTPESLRLEYADPESDVLIEGAAGQYSDGEITIPVSRLTETRQQSFDTLIHELVHAYNDRKSSSVSDWWWEEGVAEYVTRRIMQENGYQVSRFYRSETEVNSTFSKCTFQRSFIQDWNPVGISYYSGYCPENAENVIGDGDTLGYAYSRTIIEDMNQKEQGIVSKVQSRMYQLNVTFTEDRNYRNNQINFFASQAADQDFTDYLRRKGLETDKWEESWSSVQNSNQTVRRYESSTRFEVYTPQAQQLDSIYQTFYSGKFNEAENQAYQLESSLEEINQSYSRTIKAYQEQESRIEKLESETGPELFTEHREILNTSVEEMRNQNFQRSLETIQRTEDKINATYTKIERYQDLNSTLSKKIDSANILESLFVGEAQSKLQQSQSSYSNSDLDTAIEQVQEAEEKWQSVGDKVIFTVLGVIIGLILLILLIRRY
jgi:hypothetical protein